MKVAQSPRVAVRLMLGASLLAVASPVFAQEAAEEGGLDEIVGNMAAVVIQVEHGDAIAYLAELARNDRPDRNTA